MIRRLQRLILRLLVGLFVASVLWVAGVSAWRLNTGWSFRFSPVPQGKILGRHQSVTVHAYGWGDSVRGEYGLEYECVELVNRYYVQVLGYRNLTRTGDADSYFWSASAKELKAFPNGGSVAPAVHDILVFDGAPTDGQVGHVAIIVEVDELNGTVTFIEQNMKVFADRMFERDVWKDTLPLRHLGDQWFVDQSSYPFPIAGWSRLLDQPVSPRSLK